MAENLEARFAEKTGESGGSSRVPENTPLTPIIRSVLPGLGIVSDTQEPTIQLSMTELRTLLMEAMSQVTPASTPMEVRPTPNEKRKAPMVAREIAEGGVTEENQMLSSPTRGPGDKHLKKGRTNQGPSESRGIPFTIEVMEDDVPQGFQSFTFEYGGTSDP